MKKKENIRDYLKKSGKKEKNFTLSIPEGFFFLTILK